MLGTERLGTGPLGGGLGAESLGFAAPLVDGGAEVYAATLSLPLLPPSPLVESGAWVYASSLAVESVANLPSDLAAITVHHPLTGALEATLDAARDRSWLDQHGDTGDYSLTLQNDDSDLALVDYGDLLRFRLRGQARFCGVVEKKDHTSLSKEEGAGKVTVISGRGPLALFEKAVVGPSRGLDDLPIEDIRSFSWMAPDFDDTPWRNAKQIAQHGEWTAWWEASVPRSWPDRTAYWIWANRADADADLAPPGYCLFRRTFTLAAERDVRFFVGFDNIGTLFLDGAEIVGSGSFIDGQYVQWRLSAGEHLLAARVRNYGDDGGPGGNPGGFICAAYTVDSTGLLDELVTHTDNTWRHLPYPDREPGFTPGRVLRILVEEAQALGEIPGISLGFTDALDSAGNAWAVLSEITVEVDRDFLAVLREMADTLIDVAVSAGALVLNAYEHGTAGVTTTVTLQKTADRATSDFVALAHNGRHTRANAIRVRYAGGRTEVTDAASIATHGRITAPLEMGAVQTEREAQRIARQLMELRKDPSEATTATLDPASETRQPYVGFTVSDIITCPDENDVDTAMRVLSVAYEEDDNVKTWPVELRDINRDDEIELRHDIWLRRRAPGAFAGGAHVSSAAGTPEPASRVLASTAVNELSFDGPLFAQTGLARIVHTSGNAVEVVALLTTVGTTNTVLNVLLNGAIWKSVTVLAGQKKGRTLTNADRLIADEDVMRVQIVTPGTGAEGLDVQVRAI